MSDLAKERRRRDRAMRILENARLDVHAPLIDGEKAGVGGQVSGVGGKTGFPLSRT